MRVSILSPDNSEEDDGTSMKTQNAPLVASFILSYTEIDNNPKLQEYALIESTIESKRKNGQDMTEIEQEYVHGQFEFQGYYYIGYGRWLFEQHRYYDTFSILERGYNYMKSQLDYIKDEYKGKFYEICNIMGECLSKMDREDEASYYFRQGAPGLTLEQANNSALSHAKLGNPVAMNQMTNWLMMVAQKKGDHPNWSEEVKQFSADVPIELTRYKKKFDEHLKNSPQYQEEFTVGYILNVLWGLNKRNISPCMFVYDIAENRFYARIEDVDAISNYRLNDKAAANKVFVLSCTHVHYITNDEEDKSILCHNTPVVIATHSVKGKDCASNIRVDMMRQNFSNNDDKRDFVRLNNPLSATFTIGYPSSLSYTTEKESLLEGIRKAIDLVDEKRFMEAYRLAKWVFECTSDKLKDEMGLKFESEDELLWEIFFEASYNVGFCLMELGKTHTAAYYLEISSHSNNYRNIQEYINCLANSQDPQALEVIDDTIEKSPKPEGEDKLKSWNFHMAFLKRRKAYVLIDSKRYSDAKSLLTDMLNDPLSKDFAKGELNYLNQMAR